MDKDKKKNKDVIMCCNGPEGDAVSVSELRRNNHARLVECMGRCSPIYLWRCVSLGVAYPDW